MKIKNKRYTSDLKIIDGRIVDNWYREGGHLVSVEDVGDILSTVPEVVVFGTGDQGRMKLTRILKNTLESRRRLRDRMGHSGRGHVPDCSPVRYRWTAERNVGKTIENGPLYQTKAQTERWLTLNLECSPGFKCEVYKLNVVNLSLSPPAVPANDLVLVDRPVKKFLFWAICALTEAQANGLQSLILR